MILELLAFTQDKIKQGETVALVTLVAKGAGTPGTTGQVMAVAKDGTTKGTIGGGRAEYVVIQQCVEAIQKKQKFFDFEFDLSETGMICGGSYKGFVTILGEASKLVIFGGGHVAQKLYDIAKNADFHVTIVEDRAEFAPFFPEALYLTNNDADISKNVIIDENTFVVICTRGHHLDYTSLKACVDEKFAYLGLIGSKTKIQKLMDRLEEEGVSEEKRKAVYAPIGIQIDNGTPGEIAVSIMAEILKIKNNGTLRHMKELRSE